MPATVQAASLRSAGIRNPQQERTKDNAFETPRLHVQSRTGHSVDKVLRIDQVNRTKEKLD
jgi:hypothetical protein